MSHCHRLTLTFFQVIETQLKAAINEHEMRRHKLAAENQNKTNLEQKAAEIESRRSKLDLAQKTLDDLQSNDGDANKQMRRHLAGLPAKCADIVAKMQRLAQLENERELCQLGIQAARQALFLDIYSGGNSSIIVAQQSQIFTASKCNQRCS